MRIRSKESKTIRLALLSILLSAFALQGSAQSSLQKNDSIPGDLLIVLKRQEGWGGSYSEITISATGDWSYQTRGGLPGLRSTPISLGVNGKPQQPSKYLTPKLTTQKLRLLIAEFEKIRFFDFGKDFPEEDEKETRSFSDAGTEVISIRINGKTKEVSNYLGDTLKRTKLLIDLAERIRGAGIWNYENGEIPANFEVNYQITGDDRVVRSFKIGANGKIVETSHTIDVFKGQNGYYAPRFSGPRSVGKLTQQGLSQLIEEFEKVGFSTFGHSTLSQDDGCSNAPPSTGEKRIHINVQINRVAQMYASLYENCDPKPETSAAKFEYINTVIKNMLDTAGVKRNL
ncbi:MAG: hypothetical protein ABI999_14095 [Acidobacteriota bacterium]